MARSRFPQDAILAALRQHAEGQSAAHICEQMGISRPTFYNWKKKYGAAEADDGSSQQPWTSAPSNALALPADFDLQFAQELITFLTTTSSGARYRLVIDENGAYIEVAVSATA